MHSGRGVVAACDLDSDHAATPDLVALGELACTVCGEPAVSSDGAFSHVDRVRDKEHRPDPGFSLE